MDQFRRALALIQKQLGALTVSQKLLMGSLAVLAVMLLFLVTQYAGTSQWVPVLPGSPAADQQRAAAYLKGRFTITERDGLVLVAADQRYRAIAELTLANQMPADTSIVFKNLAEHQHWMMPKSQMDQMLRIAVQNELAKAIAAMQGVESATVLIDAPEPRGLGASVRRPTAQATLQTNGRASLTQDMVDAIAEMIAGSIAGMSAADVRVIDGTRGKRHRARAGDQFSASDYLEAVTRYEQRVQDKIQAHLDYIHNIVVSVNAQVDMSQSRTETRRVLPAGQGSETLIVEERETEKSTTQMAGAAEPGLRSNLQMDTARSGSGSTTNQRDAQTESRFASQFGQENTVRVDPSGRPQRIFVAVSVPKNWAFQLAKAKAADGQDPTEADILTEWTSEEARIRAEVQKLVATYEGVETTAADTVSVSMIPVLLPSASMQVGGGGVIGGLLGGSGAGGATTLGPLVKNVALIALAAVSLGMMLLMMRKATQNVQLPSAEELVGIPPPLETDNDLVGEAEEGDTAMAGIEIDDASLKSKKMLEQVSDLIRTSPSEAASLFNRWVQAES